MMDKLKEGLADPLWRLCSGKIYKIRTADGEGVIPFHPRPEQIQVLETLTGRRWDPATQRSELVDKPVKKLLIPKARRLGMSTTLGLYQLDGGLFTAGFQSSLVDQNAGDASKKLDGIVGVALDNLPSWLKPLIHRGKDNDSHLELIVAGRPKSDIYAGMFARGSSNDFLWISEWGVIQMEDPKRSAKIRSGSLPSARHGTTVVETTWKGGKGGDVWELLEPTLTGKSDDWTVLFFPWFLDPRNVSETAMIDAEAEAYFEKIAGRAAAMGIEFSEEQRRWWAAERREQGIFMQQENPTFLDECWSSPIKGSIYGEAIDRARTEGRIGKFPIDGAAPVNTSWDLGAPQNTVVWYWQVVGREILVIDVDREYEGTLADRVAMMKDKGYRFGTHYLPHDCQQTDRTGRTLLGELRELGLRDLIPVPRTHSIWLGINQLLQLFPAISFRESHVKDALDGLACYHQRPARQGSLTTAEPVHDWSSHIADALRCMAEAHRAGLFKFSHTSAASGEVAAEQYRQPRRGLRPMRVG